MICLDEFKHGELLMILPCSDGKINIQSTYETNFGNNSFINKNESIFSSKRKESYISS